jgi:acetylornithine/N-succinyldiaminopimelate aminotransferase
MNVETTKTQSLIDKAKQYLMHNYGPRNMALVRGEGVYVWDAEGNRYLDLLSGLGVNNLGHCHPKVTAALQKQAETLLHVSNLYLIEPQVELAEILVKHSPADKVFFCNSGAEAVEAAIKMARRFSFDTHGEGRHTIISLTDSFHGRTMAAISATGQPKYHTGFQPMVEGFRFVAVNDVDALKEVYDDTVCAILMEPVQGEGGIYPCTSEFAKTARELCDSTGALLIFDEIQCGLGRSGHLFASEEFGVEPDAITLAKSLAGGAPIGALLAKDQPAAALVAGTHASTFGGNPLTTAAAVAAMNVIIDEQLPKRSKELGELFQSKLKELQAKYPEQILEVRGRGLMIGVQLAYPSVEIFSKLKEQGVLAGPAGPNVLRFLPPLIIEEDLLLSIIPMVDEIFAARDA